MRKSRSLVWATGWLIAVSSQGCGCTKTEPDRKTAGANEQAQKPLESPEPKPPQEKKPADESQKKDTASTDAPPVDSPQQGSSEDKAAAAETPPASTSNAGTGAGSTKNQTGLPEAKGDPGAAKRRAKELSAAGKKSASNGNHAKAFREARAGWEAVAGFTQDGECRALTQTLLEQMRQYGSEANARAKPESFKTLVIE